MERVNLRVTSTGPGIAITVDRGKRDGLEVGDLVVFYPREGGSYRGAVTQVDDRSAVVEPHDRSFAPTPGIRGEVLIPKARLAPPDKPVAVPVPVVPKPDTPEHPPWENKDEEWAPGQNLLAQVKPVPPEDRATRVTGRAWMFTDLNYSSTDSLRNSVFRLGTDMVVENPAGRGGALRLDAEFNYLTEVNDKRGADLLVRQLSYAWGGTRFSNTRWEVGRFLQHDMPEFGILDGVQWGQRTPSGSRYGLSLGFLPELNEDFESLEDLQLAGYYLWTADNREQLTIGAGYQKSWHNGKTDRDLLVLKTNYLPLEGWNVHGVLWIDFYYGRDDIKGSGAELTQALVSVNRRWESGSGLDLTWRRLRFAETLRDEFLPLLPPELSDNRYDKLSLTGWAMAGDTRWHSQVSGWADQDETGGNAELGLDLPDVFFERSHTDLTVFGGETKFSSLLGGRITIGKYTDNGRWDLYYEISHSHFYGFADNFGDLFQHRFGAARSLYSDSGWNLDLIGEGRIWDEDMSWSLSLYLQKSF